MRVVANGLVPVPGLGDIRAADIARGAPGSRSFRSGSAELDDEVAGLRTAAERMARLEERMQGVIDTGTTLVHYALKCTLMSPNASECSRMPFFCCGVYVALM